MVTFAPLWALTPPQICWMTWPLAYVHLSVHPPTAADELFVIFTPPWKAPPHCPAMLYATEQPPAGGGDEDAERDGDTDTDGETDRDGDTETDADGVAEYDGSGPVRSP